MKRRTIGGGWISARSFSTACGECGMPTLGWDEFHPYEACAEFKRTHDSRTIEPLLARLWAERETSNTDSGRDK